MPLDVESDRVGSRSGIFDRRLDGSKSDVSSLDNDIGFHLGDISEFLRHHIDFTGLA